MSRHQCPVTFGEAVNVTQRDGYDNQPSFTTDGSAILYTSIREDGQADTYRYDRATGSIRQITHTAESEYSPTVMPGDERFAVVRVEMDSTQRLWAFRLDGSDPQLLLPNVAPVGYQAWGDADHVALYVLGDPATLQLADVSTGAVRTIATDVGRSLHRIPGRHAVSFVQRMSDDEAWIESYDLDTGAVERLDRTVGNGEDYAWNADAQLLMADDSVLYGAGCDGSVTWEKLTDFSDYGISRITRLAVSPDGRWLAMVAADSR